MPPIRLIGAIAVLLAAAHPAAPLGHAGTLDDWVLIDDFEAPAFGDGDQLHGRNDWTTLLGSSSGGTGNIRTRDFDDNMVMRLQASSGSSSSSRRGAYKALNAPSVDGDMRIADGSVSTVFHRFYVESGAADYAHSIGLTNESGPGAFNDFRLNVRLIDGELRHDYRDTGSGGNFQSQTLATIDDETWYNLWLVIDNATGHANDSFSVYLNTGVAHATEADLIGSDLLFREGVNTGEHGIAGALNTFFIYATQDQQRFVRYDEIHVSSGMNLTNIMIPEPGTFALGLLGAALMMLRRRRR